MEKKKKWSVFLKFSLAALAVSILLTAGCAALRAGAELRGLKCRSWVDFTAGGSLFFLLPVSVSGVLFSILNAMRKKGGTKYVASVFCMAVLFIAMGIYLCIMSFLSLLAKECLVEKESFLSADILEGRTDAFLGAVSDREYRFYTRQSIFFKKPYYNMDEIVRLKLERKYGERFIQTGRAPSEDGGTVYGLMSEQTHTPFRAVLDNQRGNYIEDDYTVSRALGLYRQLRTVGNSARAEVSSIEQAPEGSGGFWEGIVFSCGGSEDMQACAQDMSAFFHALDEDSFLKDKTLHVDVRIRSEWETDVEVEFTYWNDAEPYYMEAEYIYADLSDAYRRERSVQPYMEKEDADEDEASDSGNHPAAEEGPQTVEGAYRRLYEQVFRDQGYPYNYSYNAKGNFYAVLMEGEGKPDADAPVMKMDRTVVYDRISKNGKYHIFVNYETYYAGDGSEYTVKFLDFYAVNMLSGEYIRADKHSWEEAGSEEYRRATGE